MSFNNSTTELIHVGVLPQPILSIAVTLLPLIILGTVLGNGMVIKAILMEKSLQQVQNYPLASLALADLLTAVVVMSQGAMYEVIQYWPLSTHLCYLWIVCDVFLCTASILNLCFIGIDRYLAISRPIWYVQVRTRCAVTGILLAWLFSALVAFPPLFDWIQLSFKPVQGLFGRGYESCHYPKEKSYVVYSTMGSFVIPLIVVMITYFHIYRAARVRIQKRRDSLPKVRLSEKMKLDRITKIESSNQNESGSRDAAKNGLNDGLNCSIDNDKCASDANVKAERTKKTVVKFQTVPGEENVEHRDEEDENEIEDLQKPANSSGKVEKPRTPRSVIEFVVRMEKICVKQERKAAIVLAVVVVLFLICWTPFFIVYNLDSFFPQTLEKHRPRVLYSAIVWLGYLNSMLNPLVYSCMNTTFRTAFAKNFGIKTDQQRLQPVRTK